MTVLEAPLGGAESTVCQFSTQTLDGRGRRVRVARRAVATGGYIGIYTPKSVYLKFFMWLFCILHPGQIEIAMTS